MNLDACFATGLYNYTQEYGSSLVDIITIMFFVSVAVGVLFAPVFLLIYQAFVKMLMMVKDPQESHTESIPKVRPQPLLSYQHDASILNEMLKRQQYFTWVFSGSVLLYAVLLALLVFFLVGIEPDEVSSVFTGGNPIAEVLIVILFVLLMTLPLLNQLMPTGFRKVLGRIFVFIGISFAIAYLSTETYSSSIAQLEEVGSIFGVVILFIGFAMRKVRNIAVLIIVVTQLYISAAFVFLFIVELMKSCGDLSFLSEGQRDLMMFFIGLPAMILFFWGLWRLIMWMIAKLVNTYERGVFSDFQLQTLLWLVLITLLFSLGVAAESIAENEYYSLDSIYPVLALLFCMGLFWLFMHRLPPWDKPQNLLYLRVFATNKGSEHLFDYIAKYWRHIGPINMIGGPDFALMNLDIKEAYYLLFKRQQIHDVFIDDSSTLMNRLKHMNYKPNSDRHYSVNEFFCTDKMWKVTVTRLAEQADHVLLDLRGFNQERKGAAFELQLLGEMDLLQHTTVVVDNQTDQAAIQLTLNTTSNITTNTLPEGQILLFDSQQKNKQILSHLVS